MKKIIALCLALVAGTADAAILVPGINTLSGTTFEAEPQLGGVVQVDDVKPFSFTTADGTISGSVQNRVVLSNDGTYDFYWRIFDTSFTGTTPFDIQEFRVGKFGSSVIGLNANYKTDGVGSVGPSRAFVFAPPKQAYVNFLFDGLDPGEDSYFMFLDTNATEYGQTAIYDFGREGSTQISGLYSTYGPATSGVPEPAAWTMMVLGFGAMGGSLRRVRSAGDTRLA